MTVYIDEAFKCYAKPGEGLTEIEAAFFDGMCDELVECYRFVPEGKRWTREDGTVFAGEMAAPHMSAGSGREAQRIYEEMVKKAAEYAEAYDEGVQSA